jgi:outer membrane protein assembly factor BamB
MLRRVAATVSVLAGLSSQAFATEWVNCADPTGEASFDFLVGGADVMSVAAITVSVGEKVWASDVANGPGDPVQVGQSFEGNGMILVDAVNAGTLIAELRLFVTAGETELPAYGGTLTIVGAGVWAVTCSGP